jgi:TetR/AcrR family transcriptional regulator, tetracycline repressor protein
MPIQKEQIIQAAITILDRDGLEGVTLRRLAKELDIKAASIYWHITNKEVLLDEMANAILEEHFGTFDFKNDKRDWAEWLDTLAYELRAAMLTHREGARVVAGAHPDVAHTLLKLWDFTVRVLHHNGFSYGQAMTIAVTVINFTFGSVIEEQASPPLAHMIGLHEQLSLGEEFPAAAAALEAMQGEDNDTHFNTSIRIIINGVRAELSSGEQIS